MSYSLRELPMCLEVFYVNGASEKFSNLKDLPIIEDNILKFKNFYSTMEVDGGVLETTPKPIIHGIPLNNVLHYRFYIDGATSYYNPDNDEMVDLEQEEDGYVKSESGWLELVSKEAFKWFDKGFDKI